MDKNWIEIILYGYTFYMPADRVRDLNYIDGKLVNISNSQISMVYEFSNTTTYPYITCPVNLLVLNCVAPFLVFKVV